MREAAVPGRGDIERTRFRLGERNEIRDVLHGQRWTDDQYHRRRGDHRNRGEILQRVVVEFAVDRRVDRDFRRAREHQRVPVRRRAHHRFGADRTSSAGAVVDDYLLPQKLGEFLREHSAHVVGAASGGEWHDQPNRLDRISLRARMLIQAERKPDGEQEEQ